MNRWTLSSFKILKKKKKGGAENYVLGEILITEMFL